MIAQRMGPVEVLIRLVRSMGPVTANQMESELMTQCTFTATWEDAARQTRSAIQHGLTQGWLERYDDESFTIASKP